VPSPECYFSAIST